MKIEKVMLRPQLCQTGDLIYSKDSDIVYMIIESKEGFILVDTIKWVENKKANNIPELLEDFNNIIVIPNDDTILALKSCRWELKKEIANSGK